METGGAEGRLGKLGEHNHAHAGPSSDVPFSGAPYLREWLQGRLILKIGLTRHHFSVPSATAEGREDERIG
jgi:hypothetical protein